jgi:hypothetical protein
VMVHRTAAHATAVQKHSGHVSAFPWCAPERWRRTTQPWPLFLARAE